MVTASEWVSAFQGMTVTGVATHYDNPVLSVASANLPALIPLNFGVNASPTSRRLCPDALEKVRTADLMLAVSAIGQGTPKINYTLYKTLSSNLEVALDGLDIVNFLSYEMRTTTQQEISALGYWGIIATVTGRDFEG